MKLLRGCKITARGSLDQFDHRSRNQIANDRDHAFGTNAHHRQGQRVVTRQDGQVRRANDRRTLIQLAGRFLDHRDSGNIGQSLNRFDFDLFAGASWDVVDADGNVQRLRRSP